MKSELIIFIIFEIIILYIGIRSFYIWYKKKEIENDKRMLVLEKRIQDNTQLIKLEIKGVFNYIDLMMKGKKKK